MRKALRPSRVKAFNSALLGDIPDDLEASLVGVISIPLRSAGEELLFMVAFPGAALSARFVNGRILLDRGFDRAPRISSLVGHGKQAL